jgi:tRNA A-37 threonylcarbamoyl transferase component Bud32
MKAIRYALAHPDFYAPLHTTTDRGEDYHLTDAPSGWTSATNGVWTMWQAAEGLYGVEEGWKVHVSARLDRAARVLATAAAVLFAEGVAFKHLSCAKFFLMAHHKHAHRAQAGKFVTAYPRDERTARRVMEALAEALDVEEGPAVLTDRRFGASRVVYYRYGAFVGRERLRLDGTVEYLVRDGEGRDRADRRATAFTAPEGIDDPFRDPSRLADYAPVPADFAPVLNGYEITRVIAPSNGGGAYEARELATGRTVFVKEARAHNGWTSYRTAARDRLRAEHEVLRAVHTRHPGTCPEPLDYFALAGHEFLVMEFLPGTPLRKWMARNAPIIHSDPTAADFAAYHETCAGVVSTVGAALERIHDCGYAFVDLNPNNVIVDDDGGVRLIDFEAAVPLDLDIPAETIGAPGHLPPRSVRFDDRRDYDAYGLSTLAQSLIAPLNDIADRHPAVLAHLRHELGRRDALHEPLWTLATRFRRLAARDFRHVPDPRDVAADPVAHLATLRERLIAGILDAADPEHPDRLFPTGPTAYSTNQLCVAHGAAGVVHALGRAGVELPAGVLERLTRDALDQSGSLPPGLHTGLAGIAWVLADHGCLDEAAKLLELADAHPLLAERSDGTADVATLAHGRAGVALTHLALHRHTGDPRYLDRAVAIAGRIPHDDAIAAELGPDNTVGLLNGRAGVALLDQQLAGATGDATLLDRGLRLLHRELEHALDRDGGILFPVSDVDRRVMPYLQSGTSGVTFVASRYLGSRDDERLATALPAMLRAATCAFSVYGTLYNGMAGLGFTLADHGRRHDHLPSVEAAYRVAARMYMYAVPSGGGLLVTGEHNLRLSADLSHGAAGVLLFLDHLLHQRDGGFFTVDAPPEVVAMR